MAGRTPLNEFVTDALLQRSDTEADRRLASNSGARFSEAGLVTLIERAENDVSLAERIGSRRDIPLQLLRRLVLAASDTVRAVSPPCLIPKIRLRLGAYSASLLIEFGRRSRVSDQYAAPQRRMS